MSSTVEKIKERLSIADVISSYITVERAGSYMKARCPFHEEKSASFFISPDRGTYYCFGCGVKGDIFSFVQEFESLDFRGALSLLAEKAGVEIEPWKKEEKDEKGNLYDALDDSAKFFEKNLKDAKEALLYLKSRGLSIDTLKKFRIGFALDEWRSLIQNLQKDYSIKQLLDAGLIKKGDSDYYDRFRSRIMFPIFDGSGRIIAFSGRTTKSDEEAKYLNSPETVLFEKSKVLFGINFAKQAIREEKEVVLVEGQMDLVMSHQAGVLNTLATSGTSFTYEHIDLIKRMTDTVVLGFDADKAGIGASFRASLMALEKGLKVKAIKIPSGKDPADMVKEDPLSWINSVKNASHVVDYFLSVMQEKDKNDQDKILSSCVLPLIRAIENSIDQARYITKVSFVTGIPEDAIRKETEKIDIHQEEPNRKIDIRKNRSTIRRAIALMYFLEEKDKEKSEVFKKKLLDILGDLPIQEKESEEEIYFEGKLYFDGVTDTDHVCRETLFVVEEEFIKSKFTKAMEDLRRAESSKDKEKIARLLEECQNLSKQLAGISKKYNIISR